MGAVAAHHPVLWLSADFNCTVDDPAYVNRILDRLRDHRTAHLRVDPVRRAAIPRTTWSDTRIDVRSVAARKPLFMDESAHDWTLVRLGRSNWAGAAWR